LLLSRRCRRRLHLTFPLLALWQLLLSRRCRRRLHLTFPLLALLQLLLSRRCRRRLHLTFPLLALLQLLLWRWLALTWLRRRRLHLRQLRSRWRLAGSLRRLFLLLLISLWRLRHDEGMIKRRSIGWPKRDSR
jgi:hypothetical protein